MTSEPLKSESLPPETSVAEPHSPKSELRRKRISLAVYVAAFVILLVVAGYLLYLFRTNQKRVAALYLTRAKDQLRRDEFDAAHDSVRKAALADSDDVQIQTELIKTEIFQIANQSDDLARWLDLQKLDKAEEDCKRLVNENGETPELLALLGIIYAHKDQPMRAMETYEKAAQLDPRYPNVRNYWGASAYQWEYPENWRELSFQKFNEAKALDQKYVSPRIGLAVLEQTKNPPSFEGAIGIFRETDEIVKTHSGLYTSWGIALDEWGRSLQDNKRNVEAYQKFAEALEKYRRADVLEPRSALIHFNIANAFGDMNRIDDALTEYRRAVELQKEFVQARYAIAYVLLDVRENPNQTEIEEAIGHLNEAIRLTQQIMTQYNERIARTADAHAQKRLNLWMGMRAAQIKGYEELLKKARAKQAGVNR